MAELVKQFDLAIEKVHVGKDVTNVSKIVGRNLERGESHVLPETQVVSNNLQISK
jgi:hypothetical protein